MVDNAAPSKRPIVRTVVTVAAGFAALALVTSVAVAGALRGDPVRVLAVTPNNAAASAEWAARALAANKEDAVPRSAQMARAALRRDATSVEAWRVMALVADARGDRALARERFEGVQQLTRRDQPTHQWLITDMVRKNRVRALVNQVDLAMRTSERNWESFLPILVHATADPRAIDPIRKRLSSKPNWRDPYMNLLVASAPNPANAARLAADLDPKVPAEKQWIQILLQRMATEKQFGLAWNYYADSHGLVSRRPPPKVQDGGFEGGGEYPFGWGLVDEPDLNGQRGARPGDDGNSLLLTAMDGASGSVARQLLALPPGSYRLTARIGDFPQEERARPTLALYCAASDVELGRLTPAGAPRPEGRYAATVRVPGNCPWQWLSVEMRAPEEESLEVPWVDDVAVRPLRPDNGR